MADSPENLEKILAGLSGSLDKILRQQEDLGGKLEGLEERFARMEEKGGISKPAPAAQGVTYDYRILEHDRRYTLWDSEGHLADMSSTRRCLALRDLPELRIRYHTGTGNRKVEYSYRIIQEGQKEPSEWVSLEYQINKGAGADFSAILELPQPILSGEPFELRHEIELVDSFRSHNEWVSMVIEYPTGKFLLEVVLPADRMILGARREISEGASQSFDKRRLVPHKVPGTDQVTMNWEEENPVTGRTYTVYWEW